MAKRTDRWQPGDVLFVTYAEMSTVEDSFEEGEIGREMLVWQDGVSGPYRSYAEIVAHFTDVPSAPTAKDAWVVYDEGDGRIEAQWTVNADNYPADRNEIESWKRGQTKLWSARLSVWITAARLHEPPEPEHIAKATGFELV